MVIPGRESDYALNHEQHHFDIAFIAANAFVKKLNIAKFTETNYATLLEKLYKEASGDFKKLQDEYDGQTINGQLKNIQAEWDILLALQLHLL
jgi:hypothetical protein